MNEYIVLRQIVLRPDQQPTGKTRHFKGTQLLPAPKSLQIVQMQGDPGYLLLYMDERGMEQTDTYHETLEKALGQAEWEFGISPSEWNVVGS